jgi:cytochrome c551/c552
MQLQLTLVWYYWLVLLIGIAGISGAFCYDVPVTKAGNTTMKLFLQLLAILALGALLSYGFLQWSGSRAEATDATQLSPRAQALGLVEARGCIACHRLDGVRAIGPSWLGIWGATRTLKDGNTVVVDEQYLRMAMQEPAAQIVEGYEALMLPAGFTDEELSLVIAFIRDISAAPSVPD